MHCAHCVEISHFVNVAKHTRDQCSIVNNFALTTSFCWSYTLLLKPLVLMHALLESERWSGFID